MNAPNAESLACPLDGCGWTLDTTLRQSPPDTPAAIVDMLRANDALHIEQEARKHVATHETAEFLRAVAIHRCRADTLEAMFERAETQHVTFIGHDGKELHPDWCRECRVEALRAETGATLQDVLAAIQQHDTDYDVRYPLVFEAIHLALKLGYPAGIRIDPAEPEWPVAYIELPAGQVSWHMPQHPAEWDGHSTDEKYRRIATMKDGGA
ncbi:MAG TPA: hypothetical protein VFQ42_08930 [Mycobacterium sp.]|nr:hypothetical protein [Mycobacterium sp.]